MQTGNHVAKLDFFQVAQTVANRADDPWIGEPVSGTKLALEKSF